MSSLRGTNNLNPFDPISTDNGSGSPSGALRMDKESIDRLVEASAAEAEAASAVWQALQSSSVAPEETSVSDDNSQVAETISDGSDNEADVRLHPRAVGSLRQFFFFFFELMLC